MVKESLAVIAPSATVIGPASPTARRLVAASVSANTRRALSPRCRDRGIAVHGRHAPDEVSALRWADVVDATAGDGVLVTVRRSGWQRTRGGSDWRRS